MSLTKDKLFELEEQGKTEGEYIDEAYDSMSNGQQR